MGGAVSGFLRRGHDIGPQIIRSDHGRFRVLFRISDARVQHGHERETEAFRDDV